MKAYLDETAGFAAASQPAPPPADPALAQDQMRLLMISEAQKAGLTWRQIASALGYQSGPEAKRAAHRLARKVQAAMLAQEVAGE